MIDPHPFAGCDHCPTCNAWLRALVRQEFRRAAREDLEDLDQPAACVHLADEWDLAAIAGVGLNPLKRYRACRIGLGTVPGFACSCETCNVKCPGFEPAANE